MRYYQSFFDSAVGDRILLFTILTNESLISLPGVCGVQTQDLYTLFQMPDTVPNVMGNEFQTI